MSTTMTKQNYRWEASINGEIITKGGNLAGCERLAFIPGETAGLPRIDLAGVKMIQRFGRGFVKSRMGGNRLPVKLLWTGGSENLTIPDTQEPIDLIGHIQPGMLIARVGRTFPWYVVTGVSNGEITIHKPYEGKTKEAETRYMKPANRREFLHCVVCQGFRLYLNDRTGQTIITPEDHEIYL